MIFFHFNLFNLVLFGLLLQYFNLFFQFLITLPHFLLMPIMLFQHHLFLSFHRFNIDSLFLNYFFIILIFTLQ